MAERVGFIFCGKSTAVATCRRHAAKSRLSNPRLTRFHKWRNGWDSNPRALSDKRFSRPPRYDHFDISPNVCPFPCHLCCLPDDKSYSNKKDYYCQHIFTQFLLYFFQMRKSPFYHGSGLFLICIEYSFLPKLCSKSFNCYNYFYYLFFVSPLPLHVFSGKV